MLVHPHGSDLRLRLGTAIRNVAPRLWAGSNTRTVHEPVPPDRQASCAVDRIGVVSIERESLKGWSRAAATASLRVS
jgi:hypothetical protein